MKRHAVVPEELKPCYTDWRMSPGLACGDFVFLTGFTGEEPNGDLPEDPETQIRNAFRKVGLVLAKAGLSYGALVDMTSYHVGLRTHLETFKTIRAEFVEEPYPAWTAIEVNGFVREGAIVEIKAVASRSPKLA
ncbi:RidA family protein [Roseibium marinum]|uniref:Enamine deaminase RidA (YjgF/YER057c/UK114 family) n=1 Tax=Roseibium marinum TaxID=281252 RepID=A0A2S3UND4_9HYPH|nr:RidA family protein [Roseibium marinum]POF29009.1 enamine deaminase RidA (YjgF/YER057c/UK114 family) [Roseibium marinum]